jgi:hypothetical protein
LLLLIEEFIGSFLMLLERLLNPEFFAVTGGFTRLGVAIATYSIDLVL